MRLGVCLHQHSQVCLRFHRSDLGDRKLHVAKSENSKIAKCGFLLPSSSTVAMSDLDRLIGEGVTLCGHACFNTTCSLATVLKGGADCDKTSRHGEPSSSTVFVIFPIDTSSGLCLRKCSLRASACARVKLLEGFWDCGRVCGDCSVFVTSHRPAHCSRAYASSLFKLCISHLKCFFVCPPSAPCTSMSVDLELAKIFG